MKVHIGTSGWNYKHWRKTFYLEEIPQSRWFDYYCKFFNSVEINMTFYRFPTEKDIEKWKNTAPDGFVFSIKGNRIITHVKKLKNVEGVLKKFLSLVSLFQDKLGPILFQFPPSFSFKEKRLEEFCRLLANQEILKNAMFSVELRDKRWIDEKCFSILKNYNVSLCLSDYPGVKLEAPLTSSFVYIRRHGPTSLYSSCYTDKEIMKDAIFIKSCLKNNMDVFIYYNNDANAWAVQNALQLKETIEKCQGK